MQLVKGLLFKASPFKLLLSALLFAAFVFSAVGAQAAAMRVLLLPFDMHGAADTSALRREVMETLAVELDSLGAEIVGIDKIRSTMAASGVKSFDEASAAAMAGSEGADFAVLGSVSNLEGTLNVDWRILDFQDGTLLKLYFKSADNQVVLLKKIQEEAVSVYDKMFTALTTRPALKKGIIDHITVAGNKRVDSAAVLRRLVSREGEPYSPDNVKEDILAIFGMGYFDDVAADLTDTASGKELRFVLKERPYLRKVVIIGNDEVGEEKLRKMMTIKENTILDRVLVRENAEIIRLIYGQEGFYLTTVEQVISYEGIDVVVTYRVTEGEEARVKRINIIGNDKFSARKLRKKMKTKKKGLLSVFTGSGKFDEYLFKSDMGEIMSLYYDNGYLTAEITEHSVQLSEDKKWFYITIALTEGDQYRISSVDVTGEILTTKEDILDKLKVKKREIYNRKKITDGISAVSFLYGDDGYANAEIIPKTTLDPGEKTVSMVVDIKKNELVYIERIEITGNTRTRDHVIRREIEVIEGELYSSTGLKRSNNNLRRLGYFEEVNIFESPGTERGRIRLDTEVIERPTGSFSIGIGFSSVDQIIGTASVTQTNLMGTGLKLDLTGTISASSNKYVFSLTEPWFMGKPIMVGASVYSSGREYPDFDMDTDGFNIRFGFPVFRRDTRANITYKFENVEISGVTMQTQDEIDDGVPLTSIQEQAGKSRVRSVLVYLVNDTRNDSFFPTEGNVSTLSINYAGGVLGGDTNFIKYGVTAIKFFGLPFGTTFSVRGAGGYVHSFEGKEVPLYERFYLGGISSIRGLKTREVGPRDPITAEFIGGESMVVSNLEFLFPIAGQKNIKGLLFYDIGNAFDGKMEMEDLRQGAGVGVRWFSPMGPLRLELGFNLDPKQEWFEMPVDSGNFIKSEEDDYQWEFSIGTSI